MGNKSYTVRKRFEKVSVNSNGVKTVSTTIQSLANTRTAADNPNYKSRILRGADATNPLSASRRQAYFIPSSVLLGFVSPSLAGKTIYDESHHPFPGIPNEISGKSVSNASNDAAMLIRKKILEETSNFSGLTFLGELRKTAHMIRHPGQQLADTIGKWLINQSRRRRRKRTVRNNSAAKAFSDSWLEAVFGWAPLISDIESIAEAALYKYQQSGIHRLSATGYGEEALSAKVYIGNNNSQEYYIARERTDWASVRWNVGMHNEVSRSNNGLERVIASSRIGTWRDIAPSAWELMPWSFLIDYFGNIGDVLTASSVSLNNVAWSARTARTRSATEERGLPFTNARPDLYVVRSAIPGWNRSVYTTVSRASGVIPLPELRFELPGSSQLLNIAALLSSRFL